MKAQFRPLLLGLIACALLAFIALVYPVYVIQPFRHQDATELNVALAVTRFRPIVDLVLLLAAVALLAIIWRTTRGWWRKSIGAVCLLLVLAFSVLSRVNIYEALLFHPLERPEFSTALKSKLAGDEKVIAVNVNGTARAYPIRIISYHHIVNDTIAGVPIVATY